MTVKTIFTTCWAKLEETVVSSHLMQHHPN